MYLAYDLKGVQSFIFSIPRLRHIVGGSALIDEFDRDIARNVISEGVELVFAGGGRGIYRCENQNLADALKTKLVREAHQIGADIAVGCKQSLTEAVHSGDELYPYLPTGSELSGHPCPESGLYPSKDGRPHPKVALRARKNHRFRFEDEQLEKLRQTGLEQEFAFFRDVTPDAEFGEKDALAAAHALGSRNRWAVIAMDGNDMGRQFREQDALAETDPRYYEKWLKQASIVVDETVREACSEAMRGVVIKWMESDDSSKARGIEKTFLPVRPLVVGGDDVIVLCHTQYAFDFVKTVCSSFEKRMQSANENWSKNDGRGRPLWPATNGKMTISAGVLFCPVSLPLSTAMTYAESLLASAKMRGRLELERLENGSIPAPACIDWEQVTEGVIDHPASRRQRDFRFIDGDANEVIELTRRPYTMDDFTKLEGIASKYEKIPGTILHQVPTAMRAGSNRRRLWLARLGKRVDAYRELVDHLDDHHKSDDKKHKCRWFHEQEVSVNGNNYPAWSTDVIDALLLLQETRRLDWQTVDEEDEPCNN